VTHLYTLPHLLSKDFQKKIEVFLGSGNGRSGVYDMDLCAMLAAEGGFYSQAGIPTVVFGPGSIADAHTDAHTKDESIELDQIVTATNVLKTFLK